MRSYDDLKHFKEKTQSEDINFQEMSGQSLHDEGSRWAIVKQVINEEKGGAESSLGAGVPPSLRPVAKNEFAAPASVVKPVRLDDSNTRPRNDDPAGQRSLLHSVAAASKPSPVADRTTSLRQPEPASSSPASRPEQTAAVSTASLEPERYKQMFSTRSRQTTQAPNKEALLKPLLEKIASCR
ncbi:cellulose biosynthesis protein BcsO [Lonsdalea britannica]|uniref:cellulose biosynthesis protein BcsO n=1 Tax=Lonsdalea britannica TaxID=1082704 RepID=UPI0026F229EB|nr:cellulose biosynthesis protein BcsO [Lonsdalea britannica]